MVRVNRLPGRVEHLAAERLDAADRLGSVRPAAGQAGSRRHCQGFDIAPRPILAADGGRTGRKIRRRIPAGVGANLVRGVIVNGVRDVAVRVGFLRGSSKIVHLICGRLLQTAARGSRPAGRQVRKRGHLGRVDIVDGFDDGAGRLVVGDVSQVAASVFCPNDAAPVVGDDGGCVGGVGAVLGSGHDRQRRRDLLRLDGPREPGVGIARRLSPSAIGIAVANNIGDGINGRAAIGSGEIILRALKD